MTDEDNAVRYCERCGDGPLLTVEQFDEHEPGDGFVVCEDADRPWLCDWCGHMVAKENGE